MWAWLWSTGGQQSRGLCSTHSVDVSRGQICRAERSPFHDVKGERDVTLVTCQRTNQLGAGGGKVVLGIRGSASAFPSLPEGGLVPFYP